MNNFFMVPQVQKNHYVWRPDNPEQDELPISEILCVLDEAPHRVTWHHYGLSNAAFEAVQEEFGRVMSQ